MNTFELSDQNRRRLQRRAEQEGCSVDELVARLLEQAPASSVVQATNLLAKLHSTETRYQLLSEVMANYAGLVLVDADGTMHIEWSIGHFEAITGRSPDLTVDAASPADNAIRNEGIARTLKGERTTSEYQIQHVAGHLVWLYVQRIPIKDDTNGRVIGFFVAAQDITARKNAEEALRQREAHFELMSEIMGSYGALVNVAEDGAMTIESHVGVFEAITGFLPQPTRDRALTDDARAIRDRDLARTLAGERTSTEYRVSHADGHPIWLHVERLPVIDPQTGRVTQFFSAAQDITARKQIEEALRQSETHYRVLTELMANYAVSSRVDADGTRTTEWVVGAFERITGYPPFIQVATHPDDAAQQAAEIARTINGEATSSEFRVRHRDGHDVWLHVTRVPIIDPETGRVVRFYSAGQDITARKHAEDALRQSEARLRSLVDSQTAFMLRTDLEARVTYVNEMSLKHFNWQREQIVGKNSFETIYEGDHAKTLEAVERCLQQPYAPVQVTLRKLMGDGTIVHTLWEFVAVVGDDGEAHEIQCVGFDITHQVQAEQLRLEHERLKANLQHEREFNGLVQRAVSALSHDLRTPLSVIGSSKDILSRYFDRLTDAQRQERLNTIERQLQFALELLDDVVLMLKGNLSQRALRPAPINLPGLCQVIIDEVGSVYEAAERLQFINTMPASEIVNIDEILLSRILLNLLSNGLKYSAADQPVQLELGQRDDWVVLRVVDHGIGIPAETLEYIFDAFFRANEVAAIPGTGLGLSIVRECVEQHQGVINVESEVGRGTAFTVELPTTLV